MKVFWHIFYFWNDRECVWKLSLRQIPDTILTCLPSDNVSQQDRKCTINVSEVMSWQFFDTFLMVNVSLKCVRNVSEVEIWQFSVTFLWQMFPENVSGSDQICVKYLSFGSLMTDFRQFLVAKYDSFQTHFWHQTLFL